MENITIKQSDEKEEALEIAKSLSNFFTSEGIESLEHDLNTQTLYGAYLEDEMFGFLVLRTADVASVEISWLAVNAKVQAHGIGTKLVCDVMNIISEKGFKIAYVKTLAETAKDDGYARTRAFYKKIGFNTLEIVSPYPGWTEENPCQILAAALPLMKKLI